MKMQNSIKAQSEIMGLAIVMILIAMGILFAIVFFSGGSDKGFTQIAEQELVSNTLSSILRTTTECEGQTIETLIGDCEVEQKFQCYGKSSCDYVEQEMKKMLTEILGKQNREYYFQIDSPDGNLKNVKPGKCRGEQSASAPYSIVFSGGSLAPKLYLCR